MITLGVFKEYNLFHPLKRRRKLHAGLKNIILHDGRDVLNINNVSQDKTMRVGSSIGEYGLFVDVYLISQF